MQERYLGDIHDFMKLNFLEFISKKINKKIGLNWYLIDPKHIGKSELLLNDGEQRSFILEDKYTNTNERLVGELQCLKKTSNRSIINYTKNTYLNNYVNFYNKKVTISNRLQWFRDSMLFFKNNDVLFLDPDNGLIVESESKNSKRSIKYINYQEIKDLYDLGKTIFFCQFQSFSTDHKTMLRQKLSKIYKNTNINIQSPIIRNRCSPNTFYISIIQDKDKQKFNSIIRSYSMIHKWTQIVNL
ncbi:MAG: hypothetical protein CMP37_03120 [Rickettsiales bacterium]|nr:hypothetical protein [Rickettsiales bacterium]OUW71031.1 MAG: hypothetical protein CBD71_03140 [Rickettsiales bacterium TMED211]